MSLGDLVIPLFGLFSLDWSLYFIALYFLLDLLANYIFFIVKSKKRTSYSNSKEDQKQLGKSILVLSSTVIAIVFLTHAWASFVYPTISFQKEFIDFLMYTEDFLPIPQVYILLPLVLLPQYQLYKNNFLMQALYRRRSVEDLFKDKLIDSVFILGALCLFLLAAIFFQLQEFIWLLVFLGGKLYYDLYLKSSLFSKM